jgi:ribosome biogenesis GTPase / thiamine phosphate phosphatase
MSPRKRRQDKTTKWQHEDDTFSRDPAKTWGDGGPTEAKTHATDIEPNAVVIAPSGKFAFVEYAGEERLCHVDPQLVEGHNTVVAPGDAVLVEPEREDLVIRAVAPRRSKLSRLVVRHRREREQVIAANVDVLVIVTAAAKPNFKPGIVDRYLISAEIGGVAPLLVVNKMDLVDTEPPSVEEFRAIGIPILLTSCETNDGLEALRDQLRGKTAVFAGQSGVGKSTILNYLAPHLELDTQEVSRTTEKGKHTTTSARLFTLPNGTRIIDTPGVKQLAVIGVTPDTIDLYFEDIAEAARHCRFRNCSHEEEPDCTVREAIESGAIPQRRYRSYLHIRAALEQRKRKY